MKLTTLQQNRAGGVLLGQAVGDALGVPYEFAKKVVRGTAKMIGGGLGPYAPGEWSDDTQMAVCIAEATAMGHDLNTLAGLNAVARSFIQWQDYGASDIGAQTSQVLRSARHGKGALATRMTRVSREAAQSGKAGNGALMRTSIVGLAELENREATADAARRVASLTHADPRCQDACVLWSEAVRVAVMDGRLDIRSGLDLLSSKKRRAQWARWIEEAETKDPSTFARNGFTVTAFQAAWSAIFHTDYFQGSPDHVEAALQTAIAIGHDTDTVAAIAGGLLGARYGVSGLKTDWTRRVHGWPGLRGRDLIRLAIATATWGWDDSWGLDTALDGAAFPLGQPHTLDRDVILGTEADLARCQQLGVTAVVSLSRVGELDIESTGVDLKNHATVWVIDSNLSTSNAHLEWTLRDAAETVYALREEGHRVLLHCRGAVHRTPSVALAYALLCDPEAPAEDIKNYLTWPKAAQLLLGEAWESVRGYARPYVAPKGQYGVSALFGDDKPKRSYRTYPDHATDDSEAYLRQLEAMDESPEDEELVAADLATDADFLQYPHTYEDWNGAKVTLY